MLAGDKVEKKKWPKSYMRKYGITNLFRLDLVETTALFIQLLWEVCGRLSVS
jgi:hypothetical protein